MSVTVLFVLFERINIHIKKFHRFTSLQTEIFSSSLAVKLSFRCTPKIYSHLRNIAIECKYKMCNQIGESENAIDDDDVVEDEERNREKKIIGACSTQTTIKIGSQHNTNPNQCKLHAAAAASTAAGR